jgi:hypothetical protein
MSDPISNAQKAVIEAALVWLKRFETSGLAVADMDPETQKLIVATLALRDLDADADA